MVSPNSVDRSAIPPADDDYVPTYYPGTTDPAAAAPIEVAAGGQLGNVNLKLIRSHTVRVKGHVSQSISAGRANISLMLLPRSNDTMSAIMAMNRMRMPDARGNFELTGVNAGSYYLTARMNLADKMYSARVPLEVGIQNIDNVNITIGPGMVLTGRVRADRETTQSLSGVRVRLMPRDSGPMVYANSMPAVKEDGSFRMEDVAPDLYNLMVIALPDGFYVKAIRFGDADVQYTGIDLTAGAGGAVDIIVSPGAAR